MSIYASKSAKVAPILKQFIDECNLTPRQAAKLMWVIFKCMRVLPWRGAQFNVKKSAMEILCKGAGVPYKNKTVVNNRGSFVTLEFGEDSFSDEEKD